jgi:hypothetical protein
MLQCAYLLFLCKLANSYSRSGNQKNVEVVELLHELSDNCLDSRLWNSKAT